MLRWSNIQPHSALTKTPDSPQVDLVDRDRLMDKLKELRLGVTVEPVESITVVDDWFNKL